MLRAGRESAVPEITNARFPLIGNGPSRNAFSAEEGLCYGEGDGAGLETVGQGQREATRSVGLTFLHRHAIEAFFAS